MRPPIRRLPASLTLVVTLFAALAYGCSKDERGATGQGSVSVAERLSKGESRRGVPTVAPVAPPPPSADGMRAEESDAAVVGGATGQTMMQSNPASSAQSDDFRTGGEVTIAPTMIVRTGQASLEVDSLEPAVARLRQLAQRVGGYIANTSLQGGRDQLRSATLEVKMPAQRFDEAVTGLSPIGKVESVNVSAEDVGEEYVDVEARVTNAHRLEERLVTLLATRTGRLQDVLQVERELARVREQIERYEGRLRYLKTRSAVSTLSVTVHERAPVLRPPGSNPIVDALRQAWRNFVGFFAALIEAMGVLVPLGVLGVGAWLLLRRWIPRGKRSKDGEG